MFSLAAQIAPQRSTQYAALATALAPQELKLSQLGPTITSMDFIELGGQEYLRFEVTALPDDKLLSEMGALAMTSAFFRLYERLGEVDGPLLLPIDTPYPFALPHELVMTRRYKGKTNELFTFFLCNIARFSSAFAAQPWNRLRVLDPLAGGGTTLFAALVLGADVAGVEHDLQDVESTATFLQQYARTEGIACKVKEERLKKLGRRWWFSLGKEPARQCVLASGETAQSAELMSNVKRPHLIITDLPYGIQHHGELTTLLTQALPVWSSLLQPGGALAMAWESARFTRADMLALISSTCPLVTLNEPPYTSLAHRVDRAIKERDVVIARAPEIP